jgi:hypothetical protein
VRATICVKIETLKEEALAKTAGGAQQPDNIVELGNAAENISVNVFGKIISAFSEVRSLADGIIFFPDGIQLIDVSVTILQNTVKFTVRGDKVKSGSLTEDGTTETH